MVDWAKCLDSIFYWARLILTFRNDWKLHQNLACPTILKTYDGLLNLIFNKIYTTIYSMRWS